MGQPISEAANQRGDVTLPLSQNIFFRTSILNFMMGKAVAHTYGEKALQSYEWKVMGVLFAFAPMPASAIAQHVTFDKAAISRTVLSLENRGLLTRQPSKMDGRKSDIHLTPSGEALYKQILAQVSAIQDQLFAALDPDKVKALFEAYAAMEGVLRELAETQRP